ncbi:hypothetical protein EVAR_10190_1 [Eumeta japonica]|uniref:Uncharacterized protein n=1 Tax=Eumeta variegata TaxID=151549 RepID=A0A4C1TEJ4_EUMVA|nr:hypothetical protein EVAR_10190_1 [Eumeta japonica]
MMRSPHSMSDSDVREGVYERSSDHSRKRHLWRFRQPGRTSESGLVDQTCRANVCDGEVARVAIEDLIADQIGGVLKRGQMLSTRNRQACTKVLMDIGEARNYPNRWFYRPPFHISPAACSVSSRRKTRPHITPPAHPARSHVLLFLLSVTAILLRKNVDFEDKAPSADGGRGRYRRVSFRVANILLRNCLQTNSVNPKRIIRSPYAVRITSGEKRCRSAPPVDSILASLRYRPSRFKFTEWDAGVKEIV